MMMRVFLALVSKGATLTGFTPTTPAEVAHLLRTATSYHRLWCKGPAEAEEADIYACLREATPDPGVITYITDADTPTGADTVIAMSWDKQSGEAEFFTAKGPVSYITPSLPPPPIEE